jgi:CheY-like chemotaxis protein
MDSNVIAAEIVAELGSVPARTLSTDDLAARLRRTPAEVLGACELLAAWGRLTIAEDGEVSLGHARAPGASRLILVAENNVAVAHVLAALLEGEGYGVLIALTLALATSVVRTLPLDLVIADSFAPTAAAALRLLAELRDLARPAPVLLFTGHRDVPEAAARAAGYAGLLPKPFDIDELLARVDAAIEREASA